MHKALRIIGFVIIYTVGTVLFITLLALFGWIWAILVLMGKIKLGPPALWEDQTARRDFKVRQVEVKMASGILACYISVAAIVVAIMSDDPDSFEGTLQDWIQVAVMVPAFAVLVAVGPRLCILWSDEWRRTKAHLEYRLKTPVLF